MKTSTKRLIQAIIFLVTAAALFTLVNLIFIPKWTGTWDATRVSKQYYNLDNVDTIVLGSSQVLTSVKPEILDKAGVNSVLRASERQRLLSSYYLLSEAVGDHEIKTVILDVLSVFDTGLEAFDRKVFDNMKPSCAKFNGIKSLCEEDTSQEIFGYLLPIYRYHSRWNEINGSDFSALFEKYNDETKGFISMDTCTVLEDFIPFSEDCTEGCAGNESALCYLNKICELCKEKDIKLILIKTPNAEWTPDKYSEIQKLSMQKNIPYLDFNTEALYNAAGLCAETDFYDKKHLNESGAEKVSNYLRLFISGKF